jgi:hypothetical protein
MVIMWSIAGSILGWISLEVINSFTGVRFPAMLNLGMAFVGGLIGYTLST